MARNRRDEVSGRGGNVLPNDTEITVWREAGRLVCQCGVPTYQHIDWANCGECSVCGKLILGRKGEELLRRRAQLFES